MSADEQAFVEAFQRGTLTPFHHSDHVRMAWIYVRDRGLEAAIPAFSHDLRGFAQAKQVPGLFHATITWAFLAIVSERHLASPSASWAAFADANPDLLTWQPSALDAYYSAERLWSDVARATFLLPDRTPAGAPDP